MDVTSCFMYEAGLPKRLWGEIAGTVAFLHNHLRLFGAIHRTFACSASRTICSVHEKLVRELFYTAKAI